MTLVIVDNGVITVERVESGEFAVVLGRLKPVDEANCTNPTNVLDPLVPAVVIEEVDLTEPVGPLD